MNPKYNVGYIVDLVCRDYDIPKHILLSRSRRRKIAHARQDGYWRALNMTGATLLQIAAAFGRKDHTTVIYGAQAHERRARKQALPDDGVISTLGA